MVVKKIGLTQERAFMDIGYQPDQDGERIQRIKAMHSSVIVGDQQNADMGLVFASDWV